MELVNDFAVNVPVDEAWKTLTDVERIAPCLPGAQLQEIEGDVYRGVVKVKVGPILAQFKGQATFVERDETNHKAVLKAEGRETGGKGNASALITAKLDPMGTSTKVTVTTDLTITGKVAQFGRGALADVSTKLLGQFVEQLESTVLQAPEPIPHEARQSVAHVEHHGSLKAHTPEADEALHRTTTASGEVAEPPLVRKFEGPEAQPVDLISTAGAPILKRLLPVLAGVAVLLLVLRSRKRKKG